MTRGCPILRPCAWRAAATLIIVLAVAEARAVNDFAVTVTASPMNGHSAIVLGHSISLTATPSAGGPNPTYVWEALRPDCEPLDPENEPHEWESLDIVPETASMVTTASAKGTITYKCTISYSDGRSGSGTAVATINGPNEVVLSGLNANSTGFPFMEAELRFTWKHNGIPIGSGVGAIIQERIAPIGYPPSDWGPSPPQESEVWYWDSPDIVDVKNLYIPPTGPGGLADWNAAPVGTVLQAFHQDVRIFVGKTCGELQEIHTRNGFDLKIVKSGDQTFKVQLQ